MEQADPGPATVAVADGPRNGQPTLVFPRLGQGSFRVLVTDAYGRRCAITSERTLPVLEAAHIRPYTLQGPHEIKNGLLLRSDLHKLFDGGYITVDPNDLSVVVSRRIREEFEKGSRRPTPCGSAEPKRSGQRDRTNDIAKG